MTATADVAPLTTAEVLDAMAVLDEQLTVRPDLPIIGFGGNPDDVEIAAILVALAAVSADRETTQAAPPEDRWGAPAQSHRYGLSTAPTTFVNSRYSR